jgi:hypothetical protein
MLPIQEGSMKRYALAAILFAAPAFAQAPQWVISHSGRLLGAEDAGLTGTHELGFSIFPNKSRPDFGTETANWTEKYDVELLNGVYALALGESTGKLGSALTGAAFGDGEPRWIEITVDGVKLEPRLRIGSVPRAVYADKAGNLACTGCVQAAALAGDIPPSKLATTGGVVTGLDADKLDGLDASDFAVDADITLVRQDLAGVKADVGNVKAAVDTANLALTGLDTDLGAVASGVDGLVTSIGTLTTAVGTRGTEHIALQSDLTTVKNQANAIASSLGTGRTSGTATQDLADIKTSLTALSNSVGTVAADVAALKGALLRTACPSDMLLVGTAGTRSALCIDNANRADASFSHAHKVCVGAGRHFCTYAEMMAACTSDGQWAGLRMDGYLDRPSTNTYSTATFSNQICKQSAESNYVFDGRWDGGPSPYRCCL